MSRSIIALGLLATSLLGCATAPVQLETERTYQVEWIGERPLIDRSRLSLTLGEDGRAYGNAGCNHWFASYTLAGDKLSFGAAGSTRKLCAPALMEQEARFLANLAKVQRWDVSPIQQLRLWPAAGKPLRLWPAEG
ncbi:lipoprotein [Pseudomonas taeanensis MS-3]|uniref:Lipoprotein n=1 Tax=Pseudomonas taeanensis MS-3 TaxID=1395571 RepID=A0A0A1YI62_9PSED|nr:META domain-containing protein [Pseudomonas taeanensis]KFX68668.1 lipoprotein [Pseudomonas taeanensis MS-3]